MSVQAKLGKETLTPTYSLEGKMHHCSTYGCKKAFPSMQELLNHMVVHYRPTQSLEGKVFLCSIPGCKESFVSMQELMNHMRFHYKPNRYFKCENCMLRFRTHRSLFKHLHVCSDESRSALPQRVEKPSPLPPVPIRELDALPAKAAVTPEPPKLQSVIRHVEKDTVVPSMDATTVVTPSPSQAVASQPGTALPGSLPSLHASLNSMPLVSPSAHPFPLLEPSLFGPPSLGRFSCQPPTSMPGHFLPYMHPSPYSLPQATVQQRLRPYAPNQGLTMSNAVWKKGTDFGVGLAAFHAKLTPEMESSLYSQL
ncbi:zinc finger protein 414 isoform X2 [Latimeria chalumnae]|uniref:zinc finger protein 414 isoform X2 n=1 Tax=Latimeria chalumnae TaxID=7897 RepID=UPI00313DEED5